MPGWGSIGRSGRLGEFCLAKEMARRGHVSYLYSGTSDSGKSHGGDNLINELNFLYF